MSSFDPNSYALKQSNIFGLPFNEAEAELIILPVPWEATVSYGTGTAQALAQVFEASKQIDLLDTEFEDVFERGIYMPAIADPILKKSQETALWVAEYRRFLTEAAASVAAPEALRQKINAAGAALNDWVCQQTRKYIRQGKKVLLLGGEHSVSLGYHKAIAEAYPGDWGILHIDAHLDLRKAYEDFRYSHASALYNTLTEVPGMRHLTSVGIRDFCHEERDFVRQRGVHLFSDRALHYKEYEGRTWQQITAEIIATLPPKIIISFDIDGLDPKLCPNTGTPVPGGLELNKVYYLLAQIRKKGILIAGIDLVEIGYSLQSDWNANVAARILYKLSNYLLSNGV